jgi:hypothetical protein
MPAAAFLDNDVCVVANPGLLVAGRQCGALTNSSHHLLQIGADQVAALVQLSGIPFRVIAPKV